MTIEHSVSGPPGCGKTEYLARQVDRARRKYDSTENIICASFTKTAAKEISQRAKVKQGPNFGTLHSICFALNGNPRIADTELKSWNEWNDRNGLPAHRMSVEGGGADTEDPAWAGVRSGSLGDNIYMKVQGLRARMVPQQMWPDAVSTFHNNWERWKAEVGLMDFTDLISMTLHEGLGPPPKARVAFYDEVQDFTALEMALIRSWAPELEHAVMIGDADQCIFTFKGADPEAFMDLPIPPENKITLSQSYRVPRAVHGYACKWIQQVQRREPVEYLPRDEDGAVDRINNVTWRRPEQAVPMIEQELNQGRSVMLLVSCSYQLAPLLSVLRKAGVPFHNPYRRKRGDWNPVAPRRGVTASDRIQAYLRPSQSVWGDDSRPWTNTDLLQWSAHLKASGVLRRGAKAAIAQAAEANGSGAAALVQYFQPDMAEAMLGEPDLNWLFSAMLSTKTKAYELPARIYARGGMQALRETPKVVVGTIHSVKGGEADTVFVFPDLSPGGMREWISRTKRDPIVRMFYVAFTRARQRLVLCAPASRASVRWQQN